jgi:chemotaxis protein MotB
MSKKRKKQTPKGGAPGWMVTYGDLMTLVLTFFILLFSFSQTDIVKFQQVMTSMQGALGILEGGKQLIAQDAGPAIQDSEMQTSGQKQKQQQTQRQIDQAIKDMQMEGRMSTLIDRRGLVIRVVDTALFDSGSADIRPEARQMLTNVVQILKDVPNDVQIEGHTDNVPINTFRFPSNWELSAARASSVIRAFVQMGINPKKLSAAGYGEYYPVAPNDSAANRQKNRRIDIVILE